MRTLWGSGSLMWLWLWLWLGCSGDMTGTPPGPMRDPWMPPSVPMAGPPRLDAVTPALGPNLGGPTLTLSGEHFAADAWVSVDGVTASQVYVWSGNRITARLPADPGTVGPVSVVVHNPDGTEARAERAFRYYAGPLPFAGAVFGPTNVSAVAAADFNQDGLLDLAAVSNTGLFVSLNDGIGGFGAATGFPVGTTPVAVVVGDWNRDGRADLAVANSGSASVSVLLGTGTGWFSTTTGLSVGTQPAALTTADWNGDGKPDLAVANGGSASVTVLLGSGDGGFASAGNLTVGTTPVALASGDWNQDGSVDLAVANSGSRTVSMLWGNGAGAFAGPSSYALASAPVSLVGGDWNQDGASDLAVASRIGKSVSVLLGDGQGGFAPAIRHALTGSPLSLATRDWGEDGKPDLVLAFAETSSTGSLRVLNSDGAGGFGLGDTIPVLAVPAFAVPVFRDFNGDLILDAAVATAAGVVLLLGEESGGLRSARLASPVPSGSLVAGEFNGDGKPDLVASGPALTAILGDGQGGILATSQQSTISGGFGSPIVGDWDGDKRLDLMGVSALGVLPAWGNGDGSFTPGNNLFSSGGSTSLLGLAAGDFDADQNLDLVVANSDLGAVQLLFGDGRRAFPIGASYAPIGGASTVATADVNSDGHLDLLVGNSTSIALYFGDGSRSFASQSRLLTPASGFLGTADVNSDSVLDLIATNGSGTVILFGNGRGEFPRTASYSLGATACVAVADVNGDQQPDLLGGGAFCWATVVAALARRSPLQPRRAVPSPWTSTATSGWISSCRPLTVSICC